MECTNYGSIDHVFTKPRYIPFQKTTHREPQFFRGVVAIIFLTCIISIYLLLPIFLSQPIKSLNPTNKLFDLSTSTNIEVIQSCASNGDRFSPKDNISLSPHAPIVEHTTIKIVPEIQHQTILGFGGAFTESACYVISQLSQSRQDEIINAYFGPPETSLGYTMGRTHINSVDFSLESYSYDNTVGDYSLNDFNIDHDKLYLLPYIHRALNATPKSTQFRLISSPWSPPAWMKGNDAMNGSSIPGLINNPRIHDAWALYLSKYVSAYHEEGVGVWGITVQNEPTNTGPWEACYFNAEQERDFIAQYLGPRMSKDHPSVNLIMLDYDRDMVPYWANIILNNRSASKYIDGVGIHWYKGNSPSLRDYDKLDYAHDRFPNKFILATEATYCPGVKLNDWSRGEAYGWDIMNDLLHWSVGWIDWNLVLNTHGGPNRFGNMCDAAIIADPRSDTFVFQPYYFFLGHFSKYIRPGAIRLDTLVNTPLSCRLKLSANLSDICDTILWWCKYGGFSCSSEALNCWRISSDFFSLKTLADEIFDQYYQQNKEQGPYACSFNGIATLEGVQAVAFKNTDGSIAGVVLNIGDTKVSYNIEIYGQVGQIIIPPHSIQTLLY